MTLADDMVTKIEAALAAAPAGVTQISIEGMTATYSPEELRTAYEYWQSKSTGGTARPRYSTIRTAAE